MNKVLFDEISIRGRFAFGVTCFELLCGAWSISNERMEELIETMWSFTKETKLNEWDDRVRNLLPNNDRVDTYASIFGYLSLDTYQQQTITNTIWNVLEIGQGNLYGAYDSKYSLLPLAAVIETLETNMINLPDIVMFQKTKAEEQHGWGNPVEKSFFRI